MNSRGRPTRGGPPAWGLGEALTTPHRKNVSCYEPFTNKKPRIWTASPNVVRVIKSRRMRWAGHVARTGERKGLYRVLVGEPETTWETQAWMGG